MSGFIFYTGIGSNKGKSTYTFRQFIDIINNNKQHFHIKDIDEVPKVDRNNYTMEQLVKLIDYCGADIT